MSHSELFIEEKDGIIKCASCGYEGGLNYEDDPVYHVLIPTLRCPKCKGLVEIIGGKECTIKKVGLVVPKVAKVDE